MGASQESTLNEVIEVLHQVCSLFLNGSGMC